MSTASKKATKAKKAKKDKLRRQKAKLVRVQAAKDSKAEADTGDAKPEKGTSIPGKPALKNDWLPLKGKASGRSTGPGHRTQDK